MDIIECQISDWRSRVRVRACKPTAKPENSLPICYHDNLDFLVSPRLQLLQNLATVFLSYIQTSSLDGEFTVILTSFSNSGRVDIWQKLLRIVDDKLPESVRFCVLLLHMSIAEKVKKVAITT